VIKKIFIVLVFLLCIPGSYFLFLWATYIDVKITSGSMYELSIGDSKKDVYVGLGKTIKSIEGSPQDVFILIKVTPESAELLATRPDYTLLVPSFLQDVGYPRFEKMDRWATL
jgi:hypothetical protein